MSPWTEELIRQRVEDAGAAAAPDGRTLDGFAASRRAIVVSYCTWLCDPDRIEEAADAAFAELERRLEVAGTPTPVDVDRLLHEATRDMAAECGRGPVGRTSALRRLSGRGDACELMPRLLAARASGRLSDADTEAVERHAARCTSCRALERRHVEAERAFEALVLNPVVELEALERGAGGEIHIQRGGAAEPVRVPMDSAGEPVPAVDSGQWTVAQDEPSPAPSPSASAVSSSSRSRRGVVAAVVALLVGGALLVAVLLSGGGDTSRATTGAVPASAPAPAAPTAAERRAAARERVRERLAPLGDRMLGPGATGADVEALQRLVGVPVTGGYDPATTAAVREFQTAHGLNPDGNAGPETKRALARGR
jgi:hypothetical protein